MRCAWPDTAYGLGVLYEREGDLEQAAGWFRRAAHSGHRRAALSLADVLRRLADERGERSPDAADVLLAEATRWLAEAWSSSGRDAATPDAIELVTDLLNRHQRRAARRALLDPAPRRDAADLEPAATA
ncbi:hypothetical protein Arub01_07770 [Actinomadura rubrobrunea]|uniref:Sel1 repeat family protein n=1 Tax=Actinomadura rubrobrunea TaxID=115335 RepID=A0A9W6PT22_9ACTN|nr:hypothetical protein Arub01_07770 [Actinomadura rubrobrunea]